MTKPGGFFFIVLLGLIFASGSLGTDIFAPAQPSVAADFAAHDFDAQLIMSVYFAGLAFAQIALGPLSDRFGRKPVLRFGLWLFSLSSLACALAPTINILIDVRFVQGVAAAAGLVTARAVARDHFEGRTLGQTMAYMSLTLSLSPVLLPPIGGLLSSVYGWRANALFLAILGALIALAMEIFIRESLPPARRSPLHPRVLLVNFLTIARHPVFLGYMLAGALSFAGLFAFVANSSFVFRDRFGVSMAEHGAYLGLAFAGHSLGAFAGARLVGKLGSLKLITIGAAVSAVSGVALLLSDMLNIGGAVSASLVMFAYLFGAGFVYPQSLASALHPFPQIAGSASALMGFVVMLASSITSIIISALYAQTPMSMTIFIAGAGILTLIVSLRLSRSGPEQAGAVS